MKYIYLIIALLFALFLAVNAVNTVVNSNVVYKVQIDD